MPYLSLIVVLVLSIALIFFLVKSASTWNWLHITMVLAVFVIGIFASVVASQVLRARIAWMKKYDSNVKQLEKAKKDYEFALYGPENAVKIAEDSLRGINTTVDIENMRRGRIWTGGTTTLNGESYNVTFETDGNPEAASQMHQDMVLYAFADREITVGERTPIAPVDFLGIFKVTNATDDAVDMKLVFMADYDEVPEPSTTWSFFEKMPLDDRDVFKVDSGLIGEAFDLDEYRNLLETEYLPRDLFSITYNDDDPTNDLLIEDATYENLIDQYAFDQLPFNQINSWLESQDRNSFEPPPEHQAVELIFDKKTQPFSVDGTGSLDSEGIFGQDGRAVDPALHLKQDVVFEKDEKIVVDRLSGQDGYDDGVSRRLPLVETEEAKVVNTFYVRPLRDYPHILQSIERQIVLLSDAIAKKEELKADLEVTEANTDLQIKEREQNIGQLEQDILKIDQDLELIRAVADQQAEEQKVKRQQLRAYYESLLKNYDELRNKQTPPTTSASIAPPQATVVQK